MLKKLFSKIKKNTKKQEEIIEKIENEIPKQEVLKEEIPKEIIAESEDTVEYEVEEIAMDIDTSDVDNVEVNTNEEVISEEDIEYIKNIKIKRGKAIKAINIYTEEEKIFKSHKICSKELNIPLKYIKENLKYGHTDYLGDAIAYLSKELKVDEYKKNYLDNKRTPLEIFNILNGKIFISKISEDKRDEILSNEKIEAVKMHYRFECIDDEYDEYFKKYGKIIKRGGKKKIELVNKNNEVIEIFKSLEECSNYLNKEKSEIIDMLKLNETKVGRNNIRYSLRNI